MFDTADAYTNVYGVGCKDCSNPWYDDTKSTTATRDSHKYVTYTNGYKMQAYDVTDKVCIGTGVDNATVCLEDF